MCLQSAAQLHPQPAVNIFKFGAKGLRPLFCCKKMKIPLSSVPAVVGWSGLLAFVISFITLAKFEVQGGVISITLFFSAALPMWCIEWSRFKGAGKDKINLADECVCYIHRLKGMLFAIIIWLVVWAIFVSSNVAQVYGFYDLIIDYWFVFIFLIPVLFLASVGYEFDQLGAWLSNNKKIDVPWHVIRCTILKAFFIPIVVGAIEIFFHHAVDSYASSKFVAFIAFFYLVDVTFASIGYLSTSKAIGAQIRSSNGLWIAWISTLICYPPFFIWLGNFGLTQYKTSTDWSFWIKSEALQFFWGAAILFLTGVYAWATISFGVRFSNLTYRGIITIGPYRWVKHPAYLAKNISWWLIYMPFMPGQDIAVLIISCLGLLVVNFVYFLRAKSEERHLKQYRKYREYSEWLSQHGVLVKIKKLIL